jgi:DNA-binding NarL/FixJ family response regulator
MRTDPEEDKNWQTLLLQQCLEECESIRMAVLARLAMALATTDQTSVTLLVERSTDQPLGHVHEITGKVRLGDLLKETPKNEGKRLVAHQLASGAIPPPRIQPPSLATLPRETRQAIAEQDITPRQRAILSLVSIGRTNREISEILAISVRTVETHRFNVMRRLQVRNIAQLVRRASDLGLIDGQGAVV